MFEFRGVGACIAFCLCAQVGLAAPASGGGVRPDTVKQSGDATEDAASSARDAREEARIERMWTREWRKFAEFYVACEDYYACVPDYVSGFGGDDPLPVDVLIRESAYEMRYSDIHGRQQSTPVQMPESDAQAALWLLTDPKPGQFGYIRSGVVREVMDDQTVVLSDVQLVDWQPVYDQYRPQFEHLEAMAIELVTGRAPVDPERPRAGMVLTSREEVERFEIAMAAAHRDLREAIRFQYAHRLAAAKRQDQPAFARTRWRIVGLPSGEAEVGGRWPQDADAGLKLVVVAIEPDGTILAVPLSQVEEGLDELQFVDAMQSREVTKAQFYDWVMAARREHRRDYILPVLEMIEANAPATQAVAVVPEDADPDSAAPANPREPRRDGPAPGDGDSDWGEVGADEGDGPQDPGFFGVPLE